MKLQRVASIFIFSTIILAAGNVFPDQLKAQLSPQISSVIESSRASNAFWAVQVRDSTGNLIENLNGEKLFRPASNLKLITSGVVMEHLGTQYRFPTTLYGRGELRDSTWIGDLIVEGSGDPSISGVFTDGDKLFLFERWTQVLLDAGIHKIEGNLIGYDGLFDDVPYPKGWEWDDLSYYYAPEINALSFNSNVVDLEVTANGPVGSRPQIQWSPFNTPFVEFINEQTIGPRGSWFNESYRRELGTNTIFLRSMLPQGYYETEPLSITGASFYFMDTFYRYIEMRGLEITGHIFIDSDYYNWSNENLVVLDTHYSEPVYKMINRLNEESDNFFAEMLLKKVSTEVYGVQGSTDLGLQIMKEYMHHMKFDTTQVILRDASGMAPATLLNVSHLNRYLFDVQQKEYFPVVLESLAIGGVSGTLSHRFRGSVVRENFFGKTGFVSGVRALSGYLDTDQGNRLSVSIITNNYSVQTSHIDFIHQRILEYLYHQY